MPTPTPAQHISFEDLPQADLVDMTYAGGTRGNISDDPLSRLLGCGNQSGFRPVRAGRVGFAYVVLYSLMNDLDWPDRLDLTTGTFVYYGDNKRPGHELHDTPQRGNSLLRDVFADTHSPGRRSHVPPFFVFTSAGHRRDIVFRGVAVPGAPNLSPTEDLVALWKSRSGQRFQNYRSVFTMLDVGVVPRRWLKALRQGQPFGDGCPPAWREWVERGVYRPLLAEPSVRVRSREDQLPATSRSGE